MPTEACILCVGPFKKELVDLLDYPEDFYDHTEEGAVVTATLFMCNTTDQSHNLAYAFGFDTWNFNKHHIKSADQADIASLIELEERSGEWDMTELGKLETLLKNGFYALYMPNG